MAETQSEGTMIPETYGRHALLESDAVEPTAQRPIVRGRHRLQPPPRRSIPFIPTLAALGALSSAVIDSPVQGEMTIKIVPVPEHPQGNLEPVVPDKEPHTLDDAPSLRRVSHFDAATAVKEALGS